MVLGLQQGISCEFRNGTFQALRSNAALYELEDDETAMLGRWVPALDGSRSLAEVAAATHVLADEVNASASDLYRFGLVQEVGTDNDVAIDPTLFYDHACASALRWVEAATEATTPDMPGPGQLLDWPVLGPLVEYWQYARTAPARLRLAARNARVASVRQLWLEFADEEEAWASQFQAALERALGARELARALPLPETAKLCDQMHRAATAPDAADQLGYAACVGAAFAAEGSSAGLLRYCEQLRDTSAAHAHVLQPFVAHAEFVATRAMCDPIRSVFAEQPMLSRRTRRVVLDHLACHVHAVIQFHRCAREFYRKAVRLNVPEVRITPDACQLVGKVKMLWTAFLSCQRA